MTSGHEESGELPGQVPVVEPTVSSVAELVDRKEGRTISVCLPACNEAATVGPIVSRIVDGLLGTSLVDEVIVLDDGSTDATAVIAAAAGAQVTQVADVLTSEPPGRGKGNVLWRSLAASSGDLIVWCDTDLLSFTTSYVTRLVAPLLNDPDLGLVKAFYERVADADGHGGGRTTELVARPLLSMFFPPLATLRQPLGGEAAGTRALLEQLPFVESYGVESAMLIDTYRRCGLRGMAQVDLGERRHRHRDLLTLSEQASEILAVVLARAGMPVPQPVPPLINQRGQSRPVHLAERPPMIEIAEYRERRCSGSRMFGQ
jgi:glucosyl-3-phosphoglycerate synthase